MPPRSQPAENPALGSPAERAFVESIREGVRSYAEGEAIDFRFGQEGFAIGLPEDPADGSFRAEVSLAEGFFAEKGFDEGMATAAINHEVEHLREWLTLVRTPAGASEWREHVRTLKGNGRLSALDNMVDDVRMNRTVIERSGALTDAMDRLYQRYAFPEADLRSLPSGQANPRHLQFAQSLLRDAMLPGEAATIDPEVAEAKERVLAAVNAERLARGLAPHERFADVVTQITDPRISPAARLAGTRRYLEPAYQSLYDRDVEDESERRANEGGQGRQSAADSEGQSEGEAWNGRVHGSPPGEPGKPREPGKGDTPERNPGGKQVSGKDAPPPGAERSPGTSSDGSPGSEGQVRTPGAPSSVPKRPSGSRDAPKGSTRNSILDAVGDIFKGKGRGKKGDGAAQVTGSLDEGEDVPAAPPEPIDLSQLKPDELFPDAYREHERHRPTPMKDADWKKLADELAKKVASGKKPLSAEKIGERRQFLAENPGERPTEEDWQAFLAWKRLRDRASTVTDASGKRVTDELREIFANILSHRRRKRPAPKAPQEEGDALSSEHLVDAWLALRHADDDAEVWQVERTKEKPAERVGRFDVTVVADLSESMRHGGKDTAQKEALVLFLATLEDFRRDIAYEEGALRDDLAVRSEAWAFGNGPIPLKPLSERLTPIDCARVVSGLTPNPDFGTHEYTVLAKIREAIDADTPYREKLKPPPGREVPEIRRVVLVFTDGESNDTTRCQEEIAALRARGVKVAAIGITPSGGAVVATYAPDGQVCTDAPDLARTAGLLLRDILKDPNLGYTEEKR